MLRQRSETMSTPSLFPCADKVKIPQIGAEEKESTLDLRLQKTPLAPLPVSTRASLYKQKNYLRRISSDLVFGEDVVRDRCFHMLPYDDKYLYEALDPTDLVDLPPRMKIPPGRHNARHSDVRHMPCNLTISKKPHLKPLKRKIMEKAMEMQRESLRKASILQQLKEAEMDDTDGVGFFLTELKAGAKKSKQQGQSKTTVPTLPKLPEETTKQVKIESKSKILSIAESKSDTVKSQPMAPSPTKSLASEKSEKKRIVEFPERKQLKVSIHLFQRELIH